MSNKKEIKFGVWQQIPSIQSTISMASLGFDFLVVDTEHSSITTQEAEAIFIAAERHGVQPFVRLSSADPYLARRYLDAGAIGIIVPVVESREAFDQFAEHCFFPPRGKRGLGLVRSNKWGECLEKYFKEFSPTIIAQIETCKGANNINEIITSSYLSGVMIGPYDLSASLNKPGDFEDQEFISLTNKVLASARLNGKTVGYHQVEPNVRHLQKQIDKGYDFIAYGTDIVAMRYALRGFKK